MAIKMIELTMKGPKKILYFDPLHVKDKPAGPGDKVKFPWKYGVALLMTEPHLWSCAEEGIEAEVEQLRKQEIDRKAKRKLAATEPEVTPEPKKTAKKTAKKGGEK